MITSSPETGTTPPTHVEVEDQLPVAVEVMVAALAVWLKIKMETTARNNPAIDFLQCNFIECGGNLGVAAKIEYNLNKFEKSRDILDLKLIIFNQCPLMLFHLNFKLY